jgi:asparagine synthase (glutamine-hydrolysing)
MCGIAGIVNFVPEAPVDEGRLKRMQQVLVHRGPDGEGTAILGQVGLAHRRLSIIDVRGGHQPMCTPEQSVWITFNGEIYNFQALRQDLVRFGYAFRTHSDTEVILNAYEHYGEDCVRYLRGMFAFALWDRPRGKLLLARDRLGIKPLYYCRSGDTLLFASEIKAILAAGISASFNRKILTEFLAMRFVAGPETFYEGIEKLLPGRILTWTRETGLRCRRYWQLPTSLDTEPSSQPERARRVRQDLEEAIKYHLVSDVPVGLFLSGGIDSSAIGALMARRTQGPVHSFAVGFGDRQCDELRYARLAAGAIGSRHHEVTLTADAFFAALPRLVWHEDEPIAFPSSIALYFVARLARAHVKVVLTGEGADELFLGYNRYRVTAWNERLGRPYIGAIPYVLRERVRHGVQRLPGPMRRYAARSFLGVKPGIRNLLYENFSVFPQSWHGALLADRSLTSFNPYRCELECFGEAPGGLLERMSYVDLQTYLVELLMKQDQMSMAASVESRVPFLDHRLVERAAAMPGRYKLRGWRTKAVLRDAVRDLLPREIMTRRKMGFPVPLGVWLRGRYGTLAESLVLGPRARERGLFDPNFVARMVREHRAGAANHADRLWLLMNLEIWQRVFLDGEVPEAVLGSELTHCARAAAA